MTNHPLNRAGVAQHIGKYSDGMLVQPNLRWVFTSGTPGLRPDGTCPGTISEQAEWAWRNVLAILEEAGMGVRDLVKVTHTLTRAEDIPAYVAVRAQFLGDARPASMLVVVPALVRPEFLVEVEAYAARPA
jgi:enamine deaminase RidA (YjgF/YER057c/UK114 family)